YAGRPEVHHRHPHPTVACQQRAAISAASLTSSPDGQCLSENPRAQTHKDFDRLCWASLPRPVRVRRRCQLRQALESPQADEASLIEIVLLQDACTAEAFAEERPGRISGPFKTLVERPRRAQPSARAPYSTATRPVATAATLADESPAGWAAGGPPDGALDARGATAHMRAAFCRVPAASVRRRQRRRRDRKPARRMVQTSSPAGGGRKRLLTLLAVPLQQARLAVLAKMVFGKMAVCGRCSVWNDDACRLKKNGGLGSLFLGSMSIWEDDHATIESYFAVVISRAASVDMVQMNHSEAFWRCRRRTPTTLGCDQPAFAASLAGCTTRLLQLIGEGATDEELFLYESIKTPQLRFAQRFRFFTKQNERQTPWKSDSQQASLGSRRSARMPPFRMQKMSQQQLLQRLMLNRNRKWQRRRLLRRRRLCAAWCQQRQTNQTKRQVLTMKIMSKPLWRELVIYCCFLVLMTVDGLFSSSAPLAIANATARSTIYYETVLLGVAQIRQVRVGNRTARWPSSFPFGSCAGATARTRMTTRTGELFPGQRRRKPAGVGLSE
uniref:Guanylate cyclase domain-containing protein n=1 Tax=Macrostomum lignano TaxID=282301 RepID=A0A1I8FHI5_9PLAT